MKNTEKLRKIWEEKKDEISFVNETPFSDAKNWTACSVLIEEVLSGKKPLCDKTVMHLADFLCVDPTDIDPDFKHADKVSPTAEEIRKKYIDALSKDQ